VNIKHHKQITPFILLGSLLILSSLLIFFPKITLAESGRDLYPLNQGNQRQPPAPRESSRCNDVDNMPKIECNTLVEFYKDTDGDKWTVRTNWLQTDEGITPCDWYGVTCTDGHVTELSLSDNNLEGSIPSVLGNLSHLTTLLLNNNQLNGKVDPQICQLQNSVTTGDLSHNRLSTRQDNVKDCLDAIDPDWEETQTSAPNRIEIGQVDTTSVELKWGSIRHKQDDKGYYAISYGTEPDGPYTPHGRTSGKEGNRYSVDDLIPGQTYYFCVQTFTPEKRDQPGDRDNSHNQDTLSECATAIATTRTANDDQVLMIVFFPADNDLSPYVDTIVKRLRQGTSSNPNVQVVLLADRLGDHNTDLYEISDGKIQERNQVIQNQLGTDELDTNDPEVMAWFLNYARNQHPATRTIVIAGGHGVGMAPEVAWLPTTGDDASASVDLSKIPALPRGIESTPGDINDGSYMSTIDFGRALAAATDNGANPFDIVYFDQCFQGNLDVLYEVHQSAEVFIASPNYAWLSAPYNRYLSRISPQSSAEEMADQIIRIYQNSLDDSHPNSIFWVRGDQIPTIGNAVSQLGTALQSAVQAGADTSILNASLGSQFVDTTQCGTENLRLGPPDELLGAESFAQNLQSEFGNGDAHGIHDAAGQLLTTLADVRSNYRVGTPYIEPTTTWGYTNTLTLLAPLQRTLTADTVWRASIYTEEMPLTAVWAPAPTYTLSITTTLAFARDGRWDNFIADWYTTELEPTVGEWCHYIPSPIVTDEVTETLTLTEEVSGNSLTLEWTASSDSETSEYWVQTLGPDDVNWTTEEIVEEETSHVVDGGGGVTVKSWLGMWTGQCWPNPMRFSYRSQIHRVDYPQIHPPKAVIM